MSANCFILGICGGSCCGKTTLAAEIKKNLGSSASVIQLDNYYKSREGVPPENRKKINYDHPDALEIELLIDHLKRLKNGESVQCPVYDFAAHDRKSQTIEILPSKIIIVEGLMIYQNAELRRLIDLKIYIDTDADIRLARRILRDTKARGRDAAEVICQYLETVKPMHEQFVERYKKYADIIVNDSQKNDAISQICKIIKKTFMTVNP